MRFTFISLFLLHFTLRDSYVSPVEIFIPNIADAGCNEGGFRLADDCYILHNEEKFSFAQAKSICVANNATLSTEQDNSLIKKLQQPLFIDYWVELTRPLDSNDSSSCAGNINNCSAIRFSSSQNAFVDACSDCSEKLPYICQFPSGNNLTSYNKSEIKVTNSFAVKECELQMGTLAQTGTRLEEFFQNDMAIWMGTQVITNFTTVNNPNNGSLNSSTETTLCFATNVSSSDQMSLDCNSKHFFVCKEPAFIPKITHAAKRGEHQQQETNPIALVAIITTIAVCGLLVTVIIIRQCRTGTNNNGYQWLPYFDSSSEDKESLIEDKFEDEETIYP